MRGFPVIVLMGSILLSTANLFAGAWTLKRGQVWAKTSLLYQKTSERYYSANTPCPIGTNCSRGDRVDFPFDGESRITAIYLDLGYGLLDRLQLNLQVPFFDISFTDLANPSRPSSTDVGDVRFFAQYRFLTTPVVAALKVGAKAPTGFFNKDAEAVPVGDGQWDLELGASFGKSLWPTAASVNLDLGYRVRFAPDVEISDRDPGDEFHFRGEAGYTLWHNLSLRAAVSGLYGDRFEQEGLVIGDSEREVLFFEPGISWTTPQGLLFEASVPFTLSGKNYPAGAVLNLGISYTFSAHK